MTRFNGIGGDLVSFTEGFGHHMWEELKENTEWLVEKTRGDERLAYKVLLKEIEITFWQDILPDRYISFKQHIKKVESRLQQRASLKKASLVSFHGLPRPHQVVNFRPFVKQHWI